MHRAETILKKVFWWLCQTRPLSTVVLWWLLHYSVVMQRIGISSREDHSSVKIISEYHFKWCRVNLATYKLSKGRVTKFKSVAWTENQNVLPQYPIWHNIGLLYSLKKSKSKPIVVIMSPDDVGKTKPPLGRTQLPKKDWSTFSRRSRMDRHCRSLIFFGDLLCVAERCTPNGKFNKIRDWIWLHLFAPKFRGQWKYKRWCLFTVLWHKTVGSFLLLLESFYCNSEMQKRNVVKNTFVPQGMET